MSARTGESVFVPAAGVTLPRVEEVGGKGHALLRLAELARKGGFAVPPFVVVTTDLFEACVGGDRGAGEARQAEIRALAIPESARREVAEAVERTGMGSSLLAVRSSAADEDGRLLSFAGQFDSVLGVQAQGLWDAVRRVWASALNPRALAYGAGGAGPTGHVRMAVVVQAMVDAEVSGVAFSADPVTDEADVAVVSAVYGLGEGLVSGELDADTHRVRFAGGAATEISRTIVEKPRAIRLVGGGGTRLDAVPPAMARAPALAAADVLQVARAARFLADELGCPQDVEWALTDARRLVVLQARPITARGAKQAAPVVGSTQASGERVLWDNSNIIESYAGVTTPLTFSFARGVYEDVYRQFCRLMGVPERVLAANQAVFAHMIGLVRGRVYYHLRNWYRMLALLPGFRVNRGFMERMMGVRESLAEEVAPVGVRGRVADFGRLVLSALRILGEERRIDRQGPAFAARVESALAPLASEDLSSWPGAQVVALYHRLEDELLRRWQPPIVNDFFAMIFFGVLCRLTERWLPESPPTLVNDLLCGEGGIISTEPARRVMGLAQSVRETPEVAAAFAETADDALLWRRLAEEPALAGFGEELRAYVRRFGDRCMEELKLETVTLAEDPVPLLGMVRAYLASGAVDPAAAWERERAIRNAAEERVRSRLRGWRRATYGLVLARARRRVRDRENLRFERTRVFGIVRRMFLALGARLAEEGRLERPRDVFHLTREELFACFEGGPAPVDLRGLVRSRRAEFEAYAREPAPPDRFETVGPVSEWRPESAAAPASVIAGGELRGSGCCPGVVRAAVRMVRDPREARGLEGRILVAERTDPGWTLLFPMAAGLLVQRGSLLSHSAIVAREIGLPCVVGIAGLMDALVDGEEVEMDGTTGVVRRLGSHAA